MSYETRKPNIKLVVSDKWFNMLISALCENADPENNPESVVESADVLYDKLMKYSRPYTDGETGIDCVDMRFFPNEASDMIWQLLVVCSDYVEVVDDFYSRLKENHIPKERKNKSE